MEKILMLFFVLVATTFCSSRVYLDKKYASIRRAYSLSGSGTCVEMNWKNGTTQAEVDSINALPGGCPPSIKVGLSGALAIRKCETKEDKGNGFTIRHVVYDRTKDVDGKVIDRSYSDAIAYCNTVEELQGYRIGGENSDPLSGINSQSEPCFARYQQSIAAQEAVAYLKTFSLVFLLALLLGRLDEFLQRTTIQLTMPRCAIRSASLRGCVTLAG